jgi:iron complex transport system substrate-binding protein
MRDINDVSADVLDVALRLHRALGPGLLESAYEALLAAMLERMGYSVLRQEPISIEFEGLRLEGVFRADLIVDGRLIVEIKSVERLAPVHSKQLLTYLRIMQQPVGLLINFGGETLKEGVKRVVNHYTSTSSSPSSSASPRLRVNNSSSGA